MRRGIGKKVLGFFLGLLGLIIVGYALGYTGPTGLSGEWEVSSIVVAPEQQDRAESVLEEHSMRVSFVNGRLTMRGPCNSQSARFFRVGNRLLAVPGFRTSRLCHWDGFSDGQISDMDRLFHRPGAWLSTIQEDLLTRKLIWIGGDVELVLAEIPAE